MRTASGVGAALLACLAACQGTPGVVLDDASRPRRRTPDAGIFSLPQHPIDLGRLPSVGVPVDGGTAAVSPPACPTPDDPTFCGDCYRWTDGGPDSLGRNAGGEGFGQVSAGDLNDDGYPDLAVGVPGALEHSVEGGSGEVFVYLGSAHGFLPLRRLWVPSLTGFGFLTATGDFDGDGNLDIAATYSGDGGGVVTFHGDGAGAFELALLLRTSDIVGPAGEVLEDIGFGFALAAADFDGDGLSDLAVGAPYWNGLGAVLLVHGDGSRQWLTYLDTSGTAGYERFGTSLARLPLPGTGEFLLVGAPESERVYLFLEQTGGVGYLGDIAPPEPRPGFGESLVLAHDTLAIGAANNVVEVWPVDAAEGAPLAYSAWTGQVRPIAIADTNGDGFVEVFATEVRSWSAPAGDLFTWFGFDGTPTAAPEVVSPDAVPARVSADMLGVASVAGDWNVDGFEDVAFGAPALLSSTDPGQLFGYYGGAEPRTSDDNTYDFEDSYFRLDQETPACDRCTALRLDDGSACSNGVCIEQACTELTGCGDGWPVPGPSPTREGCDDRNLVDGDACSSTCQPTPFVVASREGAIDVPATAEAVALDGAGGALVVWVAELETATEVRARRYTRYGVEMDPAEDDEPIRIAAMPGPGASPQPVVAGLPGGGWRVAWGQSAGGEVRTIAMRDVRPDGTMSAAVPVTGSDEIHASDPALLAFENGAAVLWTDSSAPGSPRVMFRLVGEDGRPTGDPAPFDTRAGSGPVITMTPEGALIAWVRPPEELGQRSRIVGVRYGEGPIDSEPFEIGVGIGPVAVASLGTEIAVAWVGHALDPAGDVYVRRIAVSGDPLVHAETRVTGRDEHNRPHAEARPSLAIRRDGWIVGWEEPTGSRIALAAETSLPPEYAAYLEPEIRDGDQRHLSLVSSPRGVWVVWSSALDEPPLQQAVLVADADTYVSEAAPDTAHGSINILRVGRLGDTSGGTGRKDTYFHWNVESLRGMRIVDARMRFSQNDGYVEALGASFFRAAGAWSEAALTWTTRVSPDGAALASTVMPPYAQNFGLFEIGGPSVVGIVGEWVAYSGANHGIVVQLNDREANVIGGDSLASREHSVVERRPTLIVDYHRPPAARATWGFILPPH